MTHGVQSRLRVPADLSVVSFVRSAMACVLTREEWPSEGAGRVLLASTEALTNAIEHGSRRGATIDVELIVRDDRADVLVLDDGRPGSTLPVVPDVPPPPTALRGRGLIIISRLSDDLDLAPHGAGTRVSAAFLRDGAFASERTLNLARPQAA